MPVLQGRPLHLSLSIQDYARWFGGAGRRTRYELSSDLLCINLKFDSLDTPPFEEEAPAPTATVGGKYVPPSMRAGGARPGEAMGRPREGLPTIRISNLSKDANDVDVRDLLARVGRPARVHIVSDHVTRLSKGFAFVSFEDRAQCQLAVDILNGVGYDNLILNVSWTGTSHLLLLFRAGLMFAKEPREPRESRL